MDSSAPKPDNERTALALTTSCAGVEYCTLRRSKVAKKSFISAGSKIMLNIFAIQLVQKEPSFRCFKEADYEKFKHEFRLFFLI